jgi:hypothetical protein
LPSQGAAWLNGEAFEYFRYLRDEPVAGLAATFVGGEGCRTVLRREPMLSSRTFMWQHFTRLTPAGPSRPSPPFHPIRADTDPTTSPPPTSTPRTVFLTQRVMCPA